MQKSVLTIIGILFIAGLISSQPVSAHGMIDVSVGPFLDPPGSLNLSIIFLTPTGQEFIPSSNNLVAVDLFLSDFGFSSSTMTVNIRSGTIGGTILGTTTQTVSIPSQPGGFVHFDFPNPVPLTPGNVHVIEVTSISNVGWNAHAPVGVDLYTQGDSYLNGVLSTTLSCCTDYSFQTYFEEQVIGGTILPIETTSLLLVGAQSTSWIIPIVLSGIGIGLVLRNKRFN